MDTRNTAECEIAEVTKVRGTRERPRFSYGFVLERSLKAAVKSCDIELARGNLFAGTDEKASRQERLITRHSSWSDPGQWGRVCEHRPLSQFIAAKCGAGGKTEEMQ